MILAVRAIGDMNASRHRLPQCRTEIQYNIDVMMTSNFTQKMSKNAKSSLAHVRVLLSQQSPKEIDGGCTFS